MNGIFAFSILLQWILLLAKEMKEELCASSSTTEIKKQTFFFYSCAQQLYFLQLVSLFPLSRDISRLDKVRRHAAAAAAAAMSLLFAQNGPLSLDAASFLCHMS
jgi:hypothetical protein